MRERNRLLQDNGGAQNGWLDGLEEAMALNGVAIAAARLTALDALAAVCRRFPKRRFRAPRLLCWAHWKRLCGRNRRSKRKTSFAAIWPQPAP